MGGLQSSRNQSNILTVIGCTIIGISVFIFIALVSYLFQWKHDQAIIESLWEVGVRSSDKVGNICGLFGARISHILMYHGFGVSSFIIILMVFTFGCKVLHISRFENLGILKILSLGTLLILTVNIMIGYTYVKLSLTQNKSLSPLVGMMTLTIGELCEKTLGIGTIILVTLLVFIFHMFTIHGRLRRNITDKVQHIIRLLSAFRRKNIINNKPFEYNEEYNNIEAIQNKGIVDDTDKITDDDNKDKSLNEYQCNVTSIPCERYTHVPDAYRYPTPTLLFDYKDDHKGVSKEELKSNESKIISTLNDFRVGISSINATIGPTVTLYEIVPQAGIKISRIKNLENDIALSLSALGIRIIAPMPGRGTIGIEVPNKHRSMVSLKEMLESNDFKNSKMELPIILGKGVSHETYIVDLTKMPHMLIAGATGQGKSVGLNTMLISLLFKKHPLQLKLVLIDPKKVELSLYSALKNHFLTRLPNSNESIVTDTKKVIDTLGSLCAEMDSRYDLLKSAGARNIREYNELFTNGELTEEKHHYLPYIVLVIDEFADLMMTSGKEVEIPIARLAQLARAIGIHLILATQRPSVNVITGIIKANFPVRISYKVTSKIDSRTILDASGAEQLVGQGDMLVSINSELIRLQCPFLSTSEINKVCEFIGAQPEYEDAFELPKCVINSFDDEVTEGFYAASDRDPLFEEAARMVVIQQQGSTSNLQRRMKLGYNRAGRLMDQLEKAGVVGAFDGKTRPVLVCTEEDLQRILKR